MRWKKWIAAIAALAALAAFTACNKPADTTESKTETTTTSPDGTVKTTEETKQVGTTTEGKTETTSKTDQGTVNTNAETFVGTVTVYKAGKTIEVLTGENTRHTVALDRKDVPVSVSGPIAVGSRVTLVEEKGDQGSRVSIMVEN